MKTNKFAVIFAAFVAATLSGCAGTPPQNEADKMFTQQINRAVIEQNKAILAADLNRNMAQSFKASAK